MLNSNQWINGFKQDAYPALGCHKSVASGKPFQSKLFPLKTALLKSSCIWTFKLSSNITKFNTPSSSINRKQCLFTPFMHTCWSSYAFDWKNTSISR